MHQDYVDPKRSSITVSEILMLFFTKTTINCSFDVMQLPSIPPLCLHKDREDEPCIPNRLLQSSGIA